MKTVLPDGRVFETLSIIKIEFNPLEPVYKYKFETVDRTVKSSKQHEWGVWDKNTKQIAMKRMEDISKEVDELLVQGWKENENTIS